MQLTIHISLIIQYKLTINLYSLCMNIYSVIYPLHSYDYLNNISIKTKVATDEGNSRNEM